MGTIMHRCTVCSSHTLSGWGASGWSTENITKPAGREPGERTLTFREHKIIMEAVSKYTQMNTSGGWDKITCAIISYDAMQSHSTAFLCWRGYSSLSRHPEEYTSWKDCTSSRPLHTKHHYVHALNAYVCDHAASWRISANANFTTTNQVQVSSH